jgi:hypothetical protein
MLIIKSKALLVIALLAIAIKANTSQRVEGVNYYCECVKDIDYYRTDIRGDLRTSLASCCQYCFETKDCSSLTYV